MQFCDSNGKNLDALYARFNPGITEKYGKNNKKYNKKNLPATVAFNVNAAVAQNKDKDSNLLATAKNKTKTNKGKN